MVDILVKSKNGEHIFKNITTFLFDLDGTLIDSLDLHIEAFQWILEKLGKSITKKQLEPLMGRTPQDIIREFFSDMSKSELLDAAGEKEDKLAEIIKSVYVYPGIEQFLIKLKQNNIKSIVISSTHKKLVKILLTKAGLFHHLNDIVSGDEVTNGKPHPEPFLNGVNKANSPADTIISIGDSIHDFQSAHQAGTKFIGILTGKTDQETFLENDCELIIEKMADIQIININN